MQDERPQGIHHGQEEYDDAARTKDRHQRVAGVGLFYDVSAEHDRSCGLNEGHICRM